MKFAAGTRQRDARRRGRMSAPGGDDGVAPCLSRSGGEMEFVNSCDRCLLGGRSL